ncbi:PIN domain-containing protein [Crocosphaera sp. XPORK-15E]|uniref:PIN domain-containing protein n=1 Tax=Crocosphaera sp. XPORK-15E TaxID=3110247 RepID=UPI002B217011|nr:PIN domain-containing protein [Crocosphaera sp. XPORK-15E]MEA5537346.1 PIN domain-containing protein [Crocosphaera sp. XPORK-15E]
MVSQLIVVYDACVLYPAPLRDLLMWLALSGLFQAKWTEKIHQEWISNVLKNRPDLTLAQLNRTKDLMNRHVRDALVNNYEYLIPTLTLPDPNDRHILATAIKAKASLIITFNLKDFPFSILKNHQLEAISPDEFILELIDIDEKAIIQAATQHKDTLKNPPFTFNEYLESLTNQRLVETAKVLRNILPN